MAINTFSMAYFYIFPPFSLIGQVTANIKRDRVEAVVVVPQWSTHTTLFPASTNKFDVAAQAQGVTPITGEATAND